MAAKYTGFIAKMASLKAKVKNLRELGDQALQEKSERKEKLFLIKFRDLDVWVSDHGKLADSILMEKKTADYNEEQFINTLTEFDDMTTEVRLIQEELRTVTGGDSRDEAASGRNTDTVPVRLPKISVPIFSGKETDWLSFISLFMSLVGENRALSDVEKLQYLRVSVQGEALELIRGLSLTNENYPGAMQLLRNRYENIRRTATLHADALMNLPAAQVNTAQHLRGIIAAYRENVEALRALKVIPDNLGDTTDGFFLFLILLRKLDPVTRGNFERSLECNREIPPPEKLIHFLEKECQALEASQETVMGSLVTRKTELTHTAVLALDNQDCVGCHKEGIHRLFQCSEFLRLSAMQRRRIVYDNRLCFNCLLPHMVEVCPSSTRCRYCRGKHHSTIHMDEAKRRGQASSSRPEAQDVSLHAVKGTELNSSTYSLERGTEREAQVVLATVIIKVQNAEGRYEKIRGILDTGSQASYITAHCARRLRLPFRKTDIQISGIAQCGVRANGAVSLHISAQACERQIMTVEAFVLQKITDRLPTAPLPQELRHCFPDLSLADPDFDKPQPVECLLGAEVFARSLVSGRVDLGPDWPVLLNTLFGWIIMGSCVSKANRRPQAVVACHAIVKEPMEDLLQRFWQIEEPSFPAPVTATLNGAECERHFVETVSRGKDGRYIVRLPFKDSSSKLGSSFHMAESRFLSLERRLLGNPQMFHMYRDFMEEYITSGHMEPCDVDLESEAGQSHYFLPHHGVLKPTSSTTKLRVVFDASARTSSRSRCSLNDLLFAGPKLQKDIIEILTRFRVYQCVFMADIKQMFRGVWMHPDDRRFQCILWRDSPEEELQIFQLKTVTFGVTSSPFLAMRVLQQLALDEGTEFPEAARVLMSDVFVDDIVTGSHSVESALQLQEQLIHLLSLAGFQLRKWASNCPQLLEAVSPAERETPVGFTQPDSPLFEVLGMGWNTAGDDFVFTVKRMDYVPTKRGVLSCIARMNDPLGLLTPVTFWAKCMLQQLWKCKVGWDDPLPEILAGKWHAYTTGLNHLSDISVSRPLSAREGELHGFCDASERGYAAVIYFLAEINGVKRLTLVLAKSKVAPVKSVSVPRLELCAAHLLAKILKFCMMTLNSVMHIRQITAWSDSTVTLAWIRTPPYLLKTFVANRVSEIQTWVSAENWKHISTTSNPADVASRGVYPSDLMGSGWLEGPEFLLGPDDEWRNSTLPMLHIDDVPERRSDPLNLLLATEGHRDLSFLEKFSSWARLLRVMAHVLRFLHNSRHPTGRREGLLSCSEMRIAEMVVLKAVQHHCFGADISALEREDLCSEKIRRLAPFLDPAGLLRVGGRLDQSNLAYSSKHPILLPKDHHATRVIIDHYHRLFLHAGPRVLQSLVAQRYWILSFRGAIRKRIYQCVTCFHHKPRNQPPMMAGLPPNRVRPGRPFSSVHIDFAGPFVGRPHKRSRTRVKMYLCLFICSATKAIHLEVVSDMTTNAFMAALHRFVSRRGLCGHIYSDQGTNLVGASRELKRAIKLLHSSPNREHIVNAAAERGIVWHFQPPAAPHFGGLHEAAIRLAKHHIGRLMGTQVLTFEELQTLFSQIEAVLNSRPLCPLSSDPGEINVLTPAHFLIGELLVTLPEATFNPVSVKNRWSLVQSMRTHFWNRWSREYLHTIIERSKWYKKSENISIGSIVLVQEDRLPPLQWRLGRVEGVSTGTDGIVRVVRLKTADGTFTRPALKVFPLPME